MNGNISLDLEQSRCISFPSFHTFSKKFSIPSNEAKIACVSNEEFIHCAGNSLRISTLSSTSFSSNSFSPTPSDDKYSYPKRNKQQNRLNEQEHTKIKWSDSKRGFSCFDYHCQLKKIAYSPKKMKPDIYVESYPEWKSLCKLSNGAELEYEGLSFNREGNRIAAFGKNKLDAKIWIWKLRDGEISDDIKYDQDCEQVSESSPFLTIEVEKQCTICSFNPSNHDQLAALFANRSKVRIYQISYILDEVKTNYIDCVSPTLNEEPNQLDGSIIYDGDYDFENGEQQGLAGPYITFTWEIKNHLLVSTKYGSIFIFDSSTANLLHEFNAIEKDIHKPINSKIYVYVTKIVLVRNYIILGFNNGVIQCRKRSLEINRQIIGDVILQRDTGTMIVEISLSPHFDQVITSLMDGSIFRFDLNHFHSGKEYNKHKCDVNENNSVCEKEYWGKQDSATFHQSIVTALSPLFLAGREAFPVIISGGADGFVKVLYDSNNLSLKVRNCFCKCLASLNLRTIITCVATLEGYPVFCVGTADGIVRFVHVAKEKKSKDNRDNTKRVIMSVLKEEKLCSDPLTTIKYNTNLKRIAIGSYKAGSVYVLSTEPHEMNIIGRITSSDSLPLVSLSWGCEEVSFLIIGFSNGIVSCFDTQKISSSLDPTLPLWSHQLDGVRYLNGLTQSCKLGDDQFLFAVHNDFRGVECFQITNDHYNDAEGVIEKRSAVMSGQTGGSCMSVNSRTCTLVTGSLSGDINIFKVRRNGGLDLTNSYTIHTGPVTTIAFSADGLRLYTAAGDGSTFVFDLCGTCGYEPLQSSYEFDHLVPDCSGIDNKEPKSKLELKVDLANLKKEELDEKMKLKTKVTECIAEIKKRMTHLIKRNKNLPESEKLDRSEFVIDYQRIEKINDDTNKEIEQLRKEIEDKNCDNNIIACRIREECWDTMLVNQCLIKPFSTTQDVVYNFAIRKMSKFDKRELDIATRLRITELYDMQRNPNNVSRSGLNWRSFLDIHCKGHFMLNAGKLDNSNLCSSILLDQDMQKTLIFEKEDGSQKLIEETDDFLANLLDGSKKHPNHSFLYPPMAVRTDGQRRIQIILMKSLMREISIDFNKCFDSLKVEKQKNILDIKRKNNRIREIMKELDLPDLNVIDPSLHDDEVPESIFMLKIDECKAENSDDFIKNHEIQGKQEDESKQEKQCIEDDIRMRGLLEMMDGKLELKRKAVPTLTLKRKEWMEKLTIKEMSFKQKEEFKAYESELQKIRDIAEQNRKSLEVELKKVQSEITDIVNKFDMKVKKLCSQRFQIKKNILACELQVLHLEQEVFENQDAINDIHACKKDVEKLKEEEKDISSLADKLRCENDRQRNFLNKLTDQMKTMDKTFRKKIQDESNELIDQETVKVLTQMYRNRDKIDKNRLPSRKNNKNLSSEREITQRSQLSRASGREGQSWIEASNNHELVHKSMESQRSSNDNQTNDVLGAMKSALNEALEYKNEPVLCENDPFKELECFDQSQHFSEITVLKKEKLPEGFIVCDQVWNKVQELRREKITKEYEMKNAMNYAKEITTLLDETIEKKIHIQDAMIRKQLLISEKEQRETISLKNPKVLISIKQGQDEVQKDNVLKDYSDIIFIPSKLIEKTNESIRKAGDERMKVLVETKNFRRKVNYLKWENKYLEAKEIDVNEQYVDWQLLRVSKQLKNIISGSPGESEHAKVTRAKLQLDKKEEAHEKKMEKLRQEVKLFQKKIKDKKNENEKLSIQLKELTTDIERREAIQSSNVEVNDSMEKHNVKMKQIMKRKKLKDTICSQKADIESLRKELDRLCLKNFPSFSHGIVKR